MNLSLEILNKSKHNIKDFDCGKETLNQFLHRFALKNQQLGLSKSWVLLDKDFTSSIQKQEIIGYFILAIQTIEPKIIQEEKLPNYQLPVTLIARIAVNKKFQGNGLGTKLLFLAIKQALKLNNNGLPTYAVVLDILDNDAMRFYQKFNFFRLLDNSEKRLFVPMKIIQKIFQAA